ncbi:MAG: efflux RND transporter permease subunit, partial [Reinekea sp.]|nr:efflux RND transporter permease subunit [Reinekea sp.]
MKTLNDRGILAYFTQHRVAANLIMIVVVLAGLISLNRLHTQLMPDITIPVISINTTWTEASAEGVEQNLTTPLENALRNLDDVEEVWSWSAQGNSNIVLRYRLDADMDDALAEATNFIAGYRDLPEGAERPEVTLEQNKEAVFSVLVATDGPVTELRPLVQQFRNDLLARGIAEVDVRGFPDEEIRVETDLLNLYGNNTSIDQVAAQIASSNQNSHGGRLESDVSQISVVTDTKVEKANAIRNLEMSNQQPLSAL